MKRFAKFEKAYNNAIAEINNHLEPSQYEPQMNGLVKWMLETDANPYAYLPPNWAASLSTAEGFASLLSCIHHAVYDDGDITFVTVDGEPRIVFVHQYEDNFRKYVLTEQEQDFEQRKIFGQPKKYDIKVLDIAPNEFGPLYDAYQAEEIKQYFINDAWAHGVEYAIKHYRNYKCWDDKWPEECKPEIEKQKKLFCRK